MSMTYEELESDLRVALSALDILIERVDILESYIKNEIGKVINIPPMFPSYPEHGDYFYDDVKKVQYHFIKDSWDDTDAGEWEIID